MARPTDGPAFAEGGGNPSTWPAAKETNGYVANETLPAEDFNGIVENHGAWLQHLEAGAQFPSIAAAVAATSAGDTFYVAPTYTSFNDQPYGEDASTNGTDVDTVAVSAMVSDGEYLWAAYGNTDVFQQAIDASTGAPSTVALATGSFTPTNPGGSITKIVQNSRYVAFLQNDRYLEVFDKATLTSQLVWDHTEAAGAELLHDIAMTETHVIAVGEARSSDSAEAVIFALSSMTEVAAYTWGATLFGAAPCWDDFVIASNVAGGTGSAFRVARVDVAAATVWEVNPSTSPAASTGILACNGRLVFVRSSTTSVMYALGCGNGIEAWSQTFGNADTPSGPLVCDAKNVYAANRGTDDTVYVVDPATGVCTNLITITTNSTEHPLVTSDHRTLYVARYLSATTDMFIDSHRVDMTQRRWLRTDENFRSAFPGKASPEVL